MLKTNQIKTSFPEEEIRPGVYGIVKVAKQKIFEGVKARCEEFLVLNKLRGVADVSYRDFSKGTRWVQISGEREVWEYRRYSARSYYRSDEFGAYNLEARTILLPNAVRICLAEGKVLIEFPGEDCGEECTSGISIERGWSEGLDVQVTDDLSRAGFDDAGL